MFSSSLNHHNDAMDLVFKALSSRSTPSEKREGDNLYEDINAPPSKRLRPETTLTALPATGAATSFPRAEEEDVEMIERFQQILKKGDNKMISKKLMDGMHTAIDRIVEYYAKPTATSEIHDRFLAEFMPMRLNNVDKLNSMPEYEMTIIQKARGAVTNYTTDKKLFPESLNNEILSLSDATFELLMSTHGLEMGCENLAALVECATSKNSRGELLTQDNRKLISILRHGLLVHFPTVESSRKLYGSFEKLLSIDEDMMIEHLLVPLVGIKGVFIRVLYSKVNSRKLLERMLDFLKLSSIPLTPPIMTALGFLLDKETELTSSVSANLFNLLRDSAGYSMSEKVAGFYTSIMNKFIHCMTEAELRQMQSLNAFNHTISKEPIHTMVEERVNILKLSGPAESDSQSSQASVMYRSFHPNSSSFVGDALTFPSVGQYGSFAVDEGTEMELD